MMKWSWLILWAMLLPARAGEVEDAIARGRAARADGVPATAIYGLEQAASVANDKQASAVIVELARCLIDTGRAEEAAAWTERTVHRDDPAVTFWRAQALAQKGDFAAALGDYERAAKADGKLRNDADFGRARMLEALDRPDEALDLYSRTPPDSPRLASAQLAAAELLIKSRRLEEARRRLDSMGTGSRAERERRDYLLGRVALETGNSREAETIYGGGAPQDRRLAAGQAIGVAELLLRDDDPEKAEARIEAFVRENPRSPLIGDLLAKLDEVRSRQRQPSNAALKQWENDDDHAELSSTSTYYLARGDERQGRMDRAIRNYSEFIQQNPGQRLRGAAVIRLAGLFLAAGRTDDAKKLLAMDIGVDDRADEARLRFLRGATEYQAGDYSAASRTFVSAANWDSAIAENALANAALAAIDAGTQPLAAEILSALRKESPSAARRIELALAFENARNGRPDTGGQLARLAETGGAVGGRARLGLAEWRWARGDRFGARSEYQRVANSTAAGNNDQADYFAVYLADDGSANVVETVSQQARDFLARHPDSPREADVRMKWGEVLMRSGDYRGARVQFEEAAARTSEADRRQSALFLAARAAAASMSPDEIDAAIYNLLEPVAAQKNGDLAVQARWEQAILQSARHRPEESVKLFDSLIAMTTDQRLIYAARLKKGDALLEWSRTQPERAADALKEWREIAASPDALPAERNEALTHAAAACEQAGDADAALAAYYEVLTAPRDRQPEYFWYYKAGFAAAQLLISHERLKEAAAIYEKMAAVPGPRAEEAKERVKLLRLRNFIWED